MESGERKRLQAIISVMVEKLGGEVLIDEAAIMTAADLAVTVSVDGILIRVVKSDEQQPA